MRASTRDNLPPCASRFDNVNEVAAKDVISVGMAGVGSACCAIAGFAGIALPWGYGSGGMACGLIIHGINASDSICVGAATDSIPYSAGTPLPEDKVRESRLFDPLVGVLNHHDRGVGSRKRRLPPPEFDSAARKMTILTKSPQ